MRVVHVVRSSWPSVGGLEASVHGLARAQAAMGVDVHVAAPAAPATTVDGVHYRPLSGFGPRRYPGARGLERAVRSADVVHAHGLDLITDAVVRMHPRVGVSTHGGFFHNDRHRTIKRAVLRWWTTPTLRRAAAVWFTSGADRERIGMAGEVIGDGIDVGALQGTLRPMTGRWVIPGRVDTHKGHHDLLDAIDAMPRGRPRQIRVVGPLSAPALGPELLARGVVLTGALPRAHYLAELRRAELVVCPSRSEGFGIAALEVMAMGVPLVLSDIAAHRELDPVAGGGVALRGAGAGERLARAVVEAPGRCAARQHAASAHSWEGVAARFVAAYRRMWS